MGEGEGEDGVGVSEGLKTARIERETSESFT